MNGKLFPALELPYLPYHAPQSRLLLFLSSRLAYAEVWTPPIVLPGSRASPSIESSSIIFVEVYDCCYFLGLSGRTLKSIRADTLIQ